ncbi:hypothetical protein HQ447_18710, partial [bacterium]|nr:hypothetical protein [bacterium]
HDLRFLLLCIPIVLHAADLTPSAGGTYIPDLPEVPTFTPPPPFVPKEPLPDAESAIVCRDEQGKTVTLQRGGASLAPDLPAPVPTPVSTQFAQLEDLRPRELNFTMSATVYNHQVTTVQWQHPITREPFEAVLGFDLSLVAHLGTFVFEGVPCRSNIFCVHMDTESVSARRAAARRLPPLPVPMVEADDYRITKGNSKEAVGVEPLLAVRGIYLAEKPRLQKLASDLKNYQLEAKAWANTHPAAVEPTVFWFKPHRNSRYLTPSDKIQQEQAVKQRVARTQEGEAP